MNEIVITENVQHLKVFQGNTLYLTIVLTDETGSTYHLAIGDKLIFGVKRHNDSAYIIKKVLTSANELNDRYTFALTPENMSITPCRYTYDIGLQFANGDFKTVVSPSIFKVVGVSARKE